MSRVEFNTGKEHQRKAAIWARQRLADRGSRQFTIPGDQDGVVFADSVGMGKTWEALAAAALILYKKRRMNGRGHVLILCPANLVTKWEDELTAGSPFNEKLILWGKSRQQSLSNESGRYARWGQNTLTHVFPIRSAKHVETRKKNHRIKVDGGTYIISQSLITTYSKKLNALRRIKWDVVIVDEAHNALAHKAIDAIQGSRRCHTKLLLTATPFQIEPHQWNRMAGKILKHGHKLLKQPEVATYIDRLATYFISSNHRDMPQKTIVNSTSEKFRRLVARTIPRSMNRNYELLLIDGNSMRLNGSLDKLGDSDLQRILGEFRSATDAFRDNSFESLYFNKRFNLATNEPTFVSTRLRRFLSMGTDSNQSPRLKALARWAESAFENDIRDAIKRGGLPRKTIAFTSWVGDKELGEAKVLKKYLSDAFNKSLHNVRKEYGNRWLRWKKCGQVLFFGLGWPIFSVYSDPFVLA